MKIAEKELEKDRTYVFRQFIRSIHATDKPTLYFYHLNYPTFLETHT
jgi:hypothetical protein